MSMSVFRPASVPFAALLLALGASLVAQGQNDGFRFKSGVDLVNVTATVVDEGGRFVSGLTKDDFTIYDNGQRQTITHFSSERVPVSLGILLDSSGSMTDVKMIAARAAIDRFITDLLGDEDELFIMEFSDRPRLLQDWTSDRRLIRRAVNGIHGAGGTAMYDAIAEALPVAAAGRHRKKALLVISDGNDRDSAITVFELRQAIRESEVLVYALGVDGDAPSTSNPGGRQPPPIVAPPPAKPPIPFPVPFPRPGTRRPFGRPQILRIPAGNERVNAGALRQITDDTGGRTEIIRELRDLNAATARIADELSRQYSLGFVLGERDGRWHTLRVEVRDRDLTVRARRGYQS